MGEAFDALVLTLVVEAVDLGWIVLLNGSAVGSDPIPIPVVVGSFFACAHCSRRLRATTSRGSSTVQK